MTQSKGGNREVEEIFVVIFRWPNFIEELKYNCVFCLMMVYYEN